MQIIPNGTKVLIDTNKGVYKGVVEGSGFQAQIWTYFVLLDDPTGYPELLPNAKIVAVPHIKIRVDLLAITGVAPPKFRFVL